MIQAIILAITEVLIFFSLGYAMRHLNFLTDGEVKRFSRLLINFTFPAYIIYTILFKTDMSRLAEYWILPVVGFGLMFLGGLLSYLFVLPIKGEEQTKRTFRHLCAINNFGFMPILLLGRVFGDEIIPFILILNVGSMFGFWTVGILLFQKVELKKMVKNILNPSFIALLLSISYILIPKTPEIPQFLAEVIGKIGSVTIPLMLMLTGASIELNIFTKNKRQIIYYSFVRLILLPLISIFLLMLLNLPKDFYNVSITVASMPAGVLSVLLAKQYNGDSDFATRGTIVSTLLSIFTIPLLLTIFLR